MKKKPDLAIAYTSYKEWESTIEISSNRQSLRTIRITVLDQLNSDDVR